MRELLWSAVAYVVSRESVANYLIERSKRTPYFNLEGYMNRWWLFNPYGSNIEGTNEMRYKRHFSWLPSIRVHHILRKDLGRHFHDHPWNARTILLKGWYVERRMDDYDNITTHFRRRGDTARILYGQYHTIDEVPEGGVFTLFFTWKYCGGWGFWVDGKKVPWRKYENA